MVQAQSTAFLTSTERGWAMLSSEDEELMEPPGLINSSEKKTDDDIQIRSVFGSYNPCLEHAGGPCRITPSN